MIFRIFFFLFFLNSNFLTGQNEVLDSKSDTLFARECFRDALELIEKSEYELALLKLKLADSIYLHSIDEKNHFYTKILFQSGLCYDYLGKFETAIDSYEHALDIQYQILGFEHPDVAASYNGIGNVYIIQGEFDIASDFYQKSLSIYIKTLDPGHPELANTYNNLGNVFYEKGYFDLAEKNYLMAGDIYAAYYGPESKDVADIFNNLGNIFNVKGDYDKAIDHYYNSLNMLKNKMGETHFNLGAYYNNLANACQLSGRNEEAIKHGKKGEQITLSHFPDGHPDLAYSYYILGNAYSATKEFPQAEKYLKKALQSWRVAFGVGNSDESYFLNGLGRVCFLNGDFNKAIEFYENGLEVSLKSYGTKHPNVSNAYKHLAENYIKICKFENAEGYIQKSLEALNYVDSKSLPFVNSVPFLIETLTLQGKLFLNKIKIDYSRNTAIQCYNAFEKAIQAINYQRRVLENPKSKFTLAREASETFLGAISICQQLYHDTGKKDYLHESFQHAESSKALYLYESLREANALAFSSIPDSLLQREKEFKTEINYLEQRRRDKLILGHEATDTSVLLFTHQLFILNGEYRSLKSAFEKDYPEYFRLKYDLSNANISDVQSEMLSLDQTLLEYVLADSSIFIYIINKDDFQLHEIKMDFPLNEWVRKFRVTTDKTDFKNTITEYIGVANNIYIKMVAPIEHLLKDKVIIVPDGALGYIPFESLLQYRPSNPLRFKDYPVWLKDKQISYCYSATLLREMKKKQHKKNTEIDFLGVAPFDDGDSIFPVSPSRYARDVKVPLFPLPKSGDEVYGIQKIFGGNVYYKTEATKAKFVSNAGNYRIIHLATHGKANDKVGDYSFLIFAEQKDSIDNELLYVRDLYNLELNADMVVLSACETGIGELQKGEGIISLARGFAYAGAKSIITSLWSVEDESTKDLMLLFYKHLKRGAAKDEALRNAKLEYLQNIKDPTLAHPFYWSGFIGIGDMKPLD